jgi:hypothetical protein
MGMYSKSLTENRPGEGNCHVPSFQFSVFSFQPEARSRTSDNRLRAPQDEPAPDGFRISSKSSATGAISMAPRMTFALPAIFVFAAALFGSPGAPAAHDVAWKSRASESRASESRAPASDVGETAVAEGTVRGVTAKETASAGAGVWRRTVDGWERTTDWRLRRGVPRPAVMPLPHPTVVAALEILISLWALLAESTYWAPRFRLGRAIASNPGSSWRKAR